MYCGCLELGNGKVDVRYLVNRHWHEITWMHHFAKLSQQAIRGNPTCFWYSGPSAGSPLWEQISTDSLGADRVAVAGRTPEPGTGYAGYAGNAGYAGTGAGESSSPVSEGLDSMCGFGELLRGAGPAPAGVPPVVGFYHVSTVGDRWIKTVRRQLSLLRFSATHYAVDKVVVGISGHFADVVPSIAELLEREHREFKNTTSAGGEGGAGGEEGSGPKWEFVDHERRQTYRDLGGSYIAREVPTLQLMFEYCAKEEHSHHWVRLCKYRTLRK